MSQKDSSTTWIHKEAGHRQPEKLPIRRISARDAFPGPLLAPPLPFCHISPRSRLKGFPPPAASAEPRGAADSSPGNSSGAGEGFGACSEEEPDPEAPENGSLPRFVPRFNFTLKDLTRFVDFNIKGRDVIVFLHIQKTGGTTFGRHLVKNIRLEQPCSCKAGQKKCTCHRPGKKETWLFSRFSTGWSCGLHADWTELTNCVPAIMEKKDCPRNHSHTRRLQTPQGQESHHLLCYLLRILA
ncbi:heparan-sulfate 6-O-sulfotransferase 3-like, partial [Carlito syrichta]|uniref:Heparan-sulfate 6-O-sulfotransferase n=1 Tax=Carlito syrichta TaxID=1868482 RepID=A0A3Q0DEX2_CARSF